MTALENQDVILNYAYTSGSNRTTSETTVVKGLGNLSRTTTLSYDASARLNGFSRPNVFNLGFTHASNGLIETVTNDSPPPLAQYVYDSSGLVQSVTLENGLTTTWSRDAAGQPLSVLTKNAANAVISGVAHTLDAASRRTSATYEDNLGQAYAYDAASQVTHGKVNISNAATASATTSPTHFYAYDPAGNRNSSLAFGQSTSYTTNTVNAYTAISGGGFQPPSPTYDAKGNTLSLPRANGTSHGLTWDSQDRLRTVTPAGSTAHSMVYDPLGRLVWTRRPDGANPPIDEIWSWSSWTLLAREVFQSSTLLETFRYTWGPDLSGSLEGAGGVGGLLAIERAAGNSNTWQIRHVHSDANGNVLALTNDSGTASARYRYSPFGETISSQDLDGSGWAAKNVHRFSTKPEIVGTGLCYYGYRFYDPQTGRWPSRDPIGERGGLNLYGFVGNEPVWHIDVLGLAKAVKSCPFDIQVGHSNKVTDREKEHQTNKSCSSGRFYGASCFRTGVGSGLAWPTPEAKQQSLGGTMPQRQNAETGEMEDNPWNYSAHPDDLTIAQTGAKAIREAEKDAPTECSDKEKCCSKIVITVNCMIDDQMRNALKNDPLAQKVCNYTNTYTCPDSKGQGGGKWSGPLIDAEKK